MRYNSEDNPAWDECAYRDTGHMRVPFSELSARISLFEILREHGTLLPVEFYFHGEQPFVAEDEVAVCIIGGASEQLFASA